MQYKEIEGYFVDDKLEGILTASQEMFDRIDMIGDKLISGILTTSVECSNTLQELNGIFAYLLPIFKVAETQKKNREERAFSDIKINIEKEGGKFVSASTDREASLRVSDYRRVRNILEGYVEICRVLIGSCQSLLKAIQEEKPL